MDTIRVSGQEINTELVRKNVRRLRIRVMPSGSLHILAPHSMPIAEIARFLHDKKNWIIASIEEYKRHPRRSPPTIEQGAKILFQGRELELHIFEGQKKNALERTDECFFLHVKNNVRDVRGEFRRQYRRLASKLLSRRTWELAHQYGLSYNKLSIKDTRSRWGSCSSANNINLNWRLVLAPAEIMDYVIVHELTHLDELNHTKRFWDLVQLRDPNYRLHRKWLHAHAPRLEL